MGQSKPIGTSTFSLLPFVDPTVQRAGERAFNLYHKVQSDSTDKSIIKDVAQGELIMKVNNCFLRITSTNSLQTFRFRM